jgi:hypothetical protein
MTLAQQAGISVETVKRPENSTLVIGENHRRCVADQSAKPLMTGHSETTP